MRAMAPRIVRPAAILLLAAAGASSLPAQRLLIGPQLTLNVPTRDFLQARSGYRARFETTAGVRAAGLVRLTRHAGVIVHGFVAQPDYRSGTTPQSLPDRTPGRTAGVGLQITGLTAVGSRSTAMLAVGPTWFRQRTLEVLTQKHWHSYSSWGISATAGVHYLLGPHFFGQVELTYHTYRSDVPPIPLDTEHPGRRQHDLVFAVGIAYGTSR